MQEQEKKRLHGNLAKVEPDENRVLPQDCRAASRPGQYGFEDLPGSPEDLQQAREAFQNGKKE